MINIKKGMIIIHDSYLDFLIDLDTLNFNDKKDMQYFDKKYIITAEEFNKNQRYRKLKNK